MTGLFDNETEHLILAGGVVTALLGLIGYAAVHNERHRHEFDYLFDKINAIDSALIYESTDGVLPNYSEIRNQMRDNWPIPDSVADLRADLVHDAAMRRSARAVQAHDEQMALMP